MDHTKKVEDRIPKLSPYGSPFLYLLHGKFHPKILTASPRAGASKNGGVGGENQRFTRGSTPYLSKCSFPEIHLGWVIMRAYNFLVSRSKFANYLVQRVRGCS